ncbi:MAG: F0F1 ATP synthase subunit A [Bacilli bacterium]|nr:F0F1 ATP synthase subunit A [Bacilli bacterium]
MKAIIEFYQGLTSQVQATIWVTLFLLLLIIFIRIKMKKYSAEEPPKGIVALAESFVGMMNDFTKNTIGKRWRSLAPYFITLAMFLFTANISGLFGFTPPTTSLTVTFTMALITFSLVQVYGVKSQGLLGHLKGFTEPIPLLLPINLISELSSVLSLSFRLFGNILSGAIITTLLYSFLGGFAVLVTPAFHALFDIAFGVLQTLVFCMLTAVYISNKLPEDEIENFE